MKFLRMFITFLKIGAFTLGGGYAMIPLIQAEVVEKKKWLNNEEFLDAIAIAQSAPGAVAVNSSVFIGYRLGGIAGAASCVLGVVLPSFVIILIISMFLYQYRKSEIVDKVFMGIRPAVVGLIASAVYKLTKTSRIKGWLLAVPVIAVAGIILGISPIVEILASGLVGVGYFVYRKRAK